MFVAMDALMVSVEQGTPDDIARQETADEIDNSEDFMWFDNDLCLETPQKQTTLDMVNTPNITIQDQF